jgi:branched-chain amino acid transport system ATP-binding protein
MEKGEVRFSGPTADLLEREDVLRSVFLQGTAAALGGSEVEEKRGPAVVRQRWVEDPAQVPALEVRGLAVSFGGIQAVKEVSFRVAPGEVLGIIGPNGAGKTTVFDLVSGFLEPTAGTVLVNGRDVTGWPPPRRFAVGLGRSFQDARIFPSLTVAENIAVALERSLEVKDPVSAMFGLPALADSEEAVAWRVHELIELLALDAYRNKFAGELSTGSRRMVDLAMVVAHRPTVLLLDEPSSGIAQREAEALGPALLAVRDQLGCALVVIEHDMPLIQSVSDRLLALDTGSVVIDGDPADVVSHPQVVASYLGDNTAAVQRSGSEAAVAPMSRSRRK